MIGSVSTSDRRDVSHGARTKIALLAVAAAVLVADVATKRWIVATLQPGDVIAVFPGLNLVHVENTGVAFGMFAGTSSPLLIVIGLLALGFIGYYFLTTPATDRMLLAALSLVLGGAVGNLVDRMVGDAVTDFIDVYVGGYHWHTFNVADSAITVGIALMLFDSLFSRRREATCPPPS